MSRERSLPRNSSTYQHTDTTDPFTSKTVDNIFPPYSQLLGRRIYVVSSKNLIRFVIRERNGEAIIIGETFGARTFSDERAPRRRRICTRALSISSECPRGPDGRRPARRDEWIIETSSRTDAREITSNIRSASRSPILDRAPICRWQVSRGLPACVAVCVSSPRRTSPGRQYYKCGSSRDRSRECTASS